jgi:hypothetical protein
MLVFDGVDVTDYKIFQKVEVSSSGYLWVEASAQTI